MRNTRIRAGGAVRRITAAVAVAALAAGCASADKNASSSTKTSASSSSGSSMSGMNMSTTSSSNAAKDFAAVAGVKPVPTQVLGRGDWQGMKITAQAMTAVPFVIFNGTKERIVKPHNASFHLMVMLNDAQTNVPIPYASVWATITEDGKVVFDERQWPMISRYMGPHYGNDVSLPGAGNYQLSLLVSPPVSARHVEYQNVWLKPHRVTLAFHWQPAG